MYLHLMVHLLLLLVQETLNTLLSQVAAVPEATIVARGEQPSSAAFSSDAITRAAAPSLICEAFPAVTTPSFVKEGRSFTLDAAVDAANKLAAVVESLDDSKDDKKVEKKTKAAEAKTAAVTQAAQQRVQAAEKKTVETESNAREGAAGALRAPLRRGWRPPACGASRTPL